MGDRRGRCGQTLYRHSRVNATVGRKADTRAKPRTGFSLGVELISGMRLSRSLWLGAIVALFAVSIGSLSEPAAQTAPFDPFEKSIPELQDALSSGATTSRALTEFYLARIAAYDKAGPQINAMITVNESALREADGLDRERAERAARGPLHGIPLVIKDNFDTADMPTTAATLALAAYRPPDDAYQVKRLREAGIVIVGKTNLHELASGITTISSLGGQTRNPYDLTRNPGGSSGGTGAAVAANFAAAGLGTDTCGSIRIPAAHNNLVGLRGTMGLLSRDGIVPLALGQDVGGPLARSVTDVALILDATVGVDPKDPVTKLGEGHAPASYRASLESNGLSGQRIGILKDLVGDTVDDQEVATIIRKAGEKMKQLGAEVVEVSIPGFEKLLEGTSVIDTEFKFDLADYLSNAPGAPVRSLSEILDRGLLHEAIEAATRRRNGVESRTSDAHQKALEKREVVKKTLVAFIERERLHALLYPTVRRKPARIGDPQRGQTCQLSATTGFPALSFPAGFTDDGLPIGMELLGLPFTEPSLLRMAYAFEQSTKIRRPPFSAPPLVAGKAPTPVTFDATVTSTGNGASNEGATRMTAKFTFDAIRSELQYTVTVEGISASQVQGVSIHRSVADQPGPVVFRLLEPGRNMESGTLTLAAPEREALEASRLYVVLYTRDGAVQRLQIRR